MWCQCMSYNVIVTCAMVHLYIWYTHKIRHATAIIHTNKHSEQSQLSNLSNIFYTWNILARVHSQLFYLIDLMIVQWNLLNGCSCIVSSWNPVFQPSLSKHASPLCPFQGPVVPSNPSWSVFASKYLATYLNKYFNKWLSKCASPPCPFQGPVVPSNPSWSAFSSGNQHRWVLRRLERGRVLHDERLSHHCLSLPDCPIITGLYYHQ